MINILNEWIKGIIISIVLSIIIEMLLPEGKNKKYINTIIGIYISFVIIAPVIHLLKGNEMDLNNIIKSNYKAYSNYETKQNIVIDESKLIKEEYINNLSKKIDEDLQNQGYIAKKIDIKIEESESNYGKILSIKLDVTRKANNYIKQIEEINIKNEEQNAEVLTEEEKDNIKMYLSKTYDVDIKDIVF